MTSSKTFHCAIERHYYRPWSTNSFVIMSTYQILEAFEFPAFSWRVVRIFKRREYSQKWHDWIMSGPGPCPWQSKDEFGEIDCCQSFFSGIQTGKECNDDAYFQISINFIMMGNRGMTYCTIYNIRSSWKKYAKGVFF